MIQSKNYSNQLTPSDVDLEYRNCNFTQDGKADGAGWKPVRIFPSDDTPRTFIECNLGNAMPPPGSTLVDCNTSIVERDRGNADWHYGRMNPDTYAVEAITPVERPHRQELVTLHVSVPKKLVTGIENQINAIDGVRKVRA